MLSDPDKTSLIEYNRPILLPSAVAMENMTEKRFEIGYRD